MGTVTERAARPNVLLLHCHDLGRHLGCYGAATVSSPRLDRLAGEGVLASRMFGTAPQCSPARASLFTGRHPHSTGVMGLTHGDFGWDLHPDEVHLGRRLHDLGYRTDLIGTHHESRVRPDAEIAARLGFDTVRTNGLAHEVADRTIAALRSSANGPDPWYLQVGFHEPHRDSGARDAPGVMGFLGDHLEPDDSLGIAVPPFLTDDLAAREEIAELQGAISYVDTQIGRVLDELDRLGLTENTITIFTTDHGLALPRAKCSLYDPGVEIAFLVRWPGGGWTGGQRIDGLLSSVDLVPTLLDTLGAPTGDGPPLQGHSFRAALDDPSRSTGRDEIFTEMTFHDYYDPRRSIRTERWKLILNWSSAPTFMDPSQGWVRRCRPVAASHPHESYHPLVELYDLESDPLELVDLAEEPEHRGTLDGLTGRLSGWLTATDDPLLAGAVTGPLHRRALDLVSGFPSPSS